MINPDSIKIVGTENTMKYIVQYYDDGPRELIIHWTVAKIISAAVEQGRGQVQSEVKKALDILR
jgi:hypothetical protein